MGHINDLFPGQKYRVIKDFKDYDNCIHPVDETWIFTETNFLPYEDGYTLHVIKENTPEVYRLQYRQEEQAEIIENFTDFVQLAVSEDDLNRKEIIIGDIFAKPLSDKRFGLLRVANKVKKEWEIKQYGENSLLYVPCQALFAEVPLINELDPEKNLYVNNLKGKEHWIQFFYYNELIPDDVIYVGNIPLSADEEKRFQFAFVRNNLHTNYWEKYIGTNSDEIKEYLKGISRITEKPYKRKDLENLLKKKPFSIAGMNKDLQNKVINILSGIVKEMLELNDKPTNNQASDILRAGIIQLNSLNDEYNGFIGTLEREKIMGFIDKVSETVLLPSFDDKDRNW